MIPWLKLGKVAALIILPLPVTLLFIWLYKKGHLETVKGYLSK